MLIQVDDDLYAQDVNERHCVTHLSSFVDQLICGKHICCEAAATVIDLGSASKAAMHMCCESYNMSQSLQIADSFMMHPIWVFLPPMAAL